MKKQERPEWSQIIMGSAVGAGGSLLVTLVLTALASNLVSREIVGESSVDALAAGILVLSSAVGAFLAFAVTGHHRLPVCMASGAAYYLMLIGCNALLFDGVYRAVGVTAVAILGGCGAVVLLGLKEGKKGFHSHRRKNRNWKVVQNPQRGNY